MYEREGLAGEFFDKVRWAALDTRVEFSFPFPHVSQPRDVVVRMQSVVVGGKPHGLICASSASGEVPEQHQGETTMLTSWNASPDVDRLLDDVMNNVMGRRSGHLKRVAGSALLSMWGRTTRSSSTRATCRESERATSK